MFALAVAAALCAVLGGESWADTGDDQYSVGAAHYVNGRWQLAADEFRALLREAPEHRRSEAARFFLGEALVQLGEHAAAQEQFEAYLQRAPIGRYARQALFRTGETAYFAGDRETARTRLGQFCRQHAADPLCGHAWCYLGQVALEGKDLEQAQAAFAKSLAEHPDSAVRGECQLGLGRAWEQQGQLDAAALAYRAAAWDPTNELADRAWFRLAAVHYAQRDFAGSERFFFTLADEFPWSELRSKALHWANNATLGNLTECVARGDHEGVERLARELGGRRLEPTQRALSQRLHAQSLVDRCEYEQAVAMLQPIVAASSSESAPNVDVDRARYLLAVAYVGLQQHAAALALCEQVASTDDARLKIAAQQTRGVCLRALGRKDEAAQALAVLLEQHPDAPDADATAYELAWFAYDAGRREVAQQLFRKLYERYPGSRYRADAAYRLADAALGEQRWEACDDWLAKLSAANPSDDLRAHGLHLAGQAAARRGQWDKVASLANELATKFPHHALAPTARFWEAEAAYRRRDYDAAERLFSALAKEGQETKFAWSATVALRRLQLLVLGNRWDEAFAAATEAARRFPEDAQKYEVDYLLGRCLAQRGEFAEARAAYARVVASPTGGKTETAAMAQFMIGETYFHQRNYAEAVKQYLRVEILHPHPTWQAAALVQAGKAYDNLGQPSEAQKLYRQVLDKYPQSEHRDEAARRLGVARK